MWNLHEIQNRNSVYINYMLIIYLFLAVLGLEFKALLMTDRYTNPEIYPNCLLDFIYLFIIYFL